MNLNETIQGLTHARDILNATIAQTVSLGMPDTLTDKSRQSVEAINTVLEHLESQTILLD